MNKDIIGPVDKVTNVSVNLGPRIVMTGSEVLGTADNISIEVAESTLEELEKLKSAYEIRLVKMVGESGESHGNNLMKNGIQELGDMAKHKCPPHYWITNSENVGHCIYCPAVKDFGELLRRDGVFAAAGQRGAKARQEVLGKRRGRKRNGKI